MTGRAHFNCIRCVSCGRFMDPSAAGSSGWQTWGYEMDGTPVLHDPVNQCPRCTEKLGYRRSNCANPARYEWIVTEPLP